MHTFAARMLFGEKPLATGTCFSVSQGERWFIVTNRHNVTGLDQHTGKSLHSLAAIPNRLAIYLPTPDLGNKWWVHILELYDQQGCPRWVEHPTLGRQADVVALPFDRPAETSCFGVVLDDFYDFAVEPGDEVTALGYRFGKPEFSLFPQWVACTLVTPPNDEYQGLPAFLVRGDTAPGSSGYPIIAYRPNATGLTHSDGRPLGTDWASRFLGVYSGRLIGEDVAGLGLVWSIDCVRGVVAAAVAS